MDDVLLSGLAVMSLKSCDPGRGSHRPLIMGLHGVVGANHPVATQAGIAVLQAGGNAADAAVAVSLMLGVVEPAMSGLGADGFFHHFEATSGQSKIFNGTGPAPADVSELFRTGLQQAGPLSISVPGKLAALGALHRTFGSVDWSRLATPAIDAARQGFGATHTYCAFAHDGYTRLAADPVSASLYLGKKPGDLIKNPALAETLEEIAAYGSETFYRGKLARRLAHALEQAGALIRERDLAEYDAEVAQPIQCRYHGLEIRQTAPNSTGFTMLQVLKILERFDLRRLSAADRIHVSVEAKKLAFVDRDKYSTDPRFREVPVDMLLSDAYTAGQADQIRLDCAANLPIGRAALESDTTYFCVVDRDGNAVSGIQSNASTFGSGVIAGDTGILLNNRLGWWESDPKLVNSISSGKRVSHTMNAPVILKDSELWGVLGTPGADNQVQVNVQALTALHDLGLDPQAAAEQPRWISSQPGQGVSWRNVGDGKLAIEVDVGAEVIEALEGKGHAVQRLAHLGAPCALQAVRVLPNGIRMAGSDPRRDGWAAAY